MGVAIVRDDGVRPFLASGELAPVLGANNPLEVPAFSVYPAGAQLRAAVTAFIEYVCERLG